MNNETTWQDKAMALLRDEKYRTLRLITIGWVVLVVVARLLDDTLGLILTLLLAAAAYFLPTIVASRSKAPNEGSVFVINLAFGWTIIGWIIAMAMAARYTGHGSTRRDATCPFCAETIKAEAVVCKHCGRDLPA